MRDVTVIGPVNIDLLMVGQGPADLSLLPTWDGPAYMEMTAAGAVGYFTRDLARLGLDVLVSACVPDDPLGAYLIEALAHDGVDVSAMRRVPDTLVGIAAFVLLFGSRKRPLVHRAPTHEPWPQALDDAASERLLDARHVHVGGYLHFSAVWHGSTGRLLRQARERGLSTSLDPQFPLGPLDAPWMTVLDDLLPWVQTLFCDETEARHLTGCAALDACAAALLAAGPQAVVIKQGAEGATAYHADGAVRQPAVVLGEVVDTIGAGDAFDAGYVYGALQGWPLAERLRLAATAAGFTVTGVGGSATFPTVEQLRAALG
ncbi:MAG: carbohydrate kinase family protein [Anaerolineae bacterium]|jgi:sugar/nucleoside kinase (ribokinase family)